MDPDRTLLLHRVNIKPGHLDAWRELWPEEVALFAEHGLASEGAFLETHAEPKLTWLYSTSGASHRALAELHADGRFADLEQRRRRHVFGNLVVRPVRPEVMAIPASDAATLAAERDRTVVMRRYSIVNGWPDFLDIWRRIAPLRERHGFRVLFAVADEPHDLFTWAFDYQGNWEDFPAAQRDYYHDPERVALRGVFDHMADYTITPAQRLALPGV